MKLVLILSHSKLSHPQGFFIVYVYKNAQCDSCRVTVFAYTQIRFRLPALQQKHLDMNLEISKNKIYLKLNKRYDLTKTYRT